MTAPRRLIFAANWKMHIGPLASREFLDRFLPLLRPAPARELWFFPPAVALSEVSRQLADRTDAKAGAQNVHWEPKGAFTGEISVPLAREAGAAGALVGHSERRHVFGETNDETRKKVVALLGAGMTSTLCVGETLAEREEGRTEAVVVKQLDEAVAGLGAAELARLIVAYEPVWAIGTGRNATPRDAAEVHRVVRRRLEEDGARSRIPILYGGSVNVRNVIGLLSEPELDGVLVGGASLDPDGWAEIVNSSG